MEKRPSRTRRKSVSLLQRPKEIWKRAYIIGKVIGDVLLMEWSDIWHVERVGISAQSKKTQKSLKKYVGVSTPWKVHRVELVKGTTNSFEYQFVFWYSTEAVSLYSDADGGPW
jgi:hypothetical protein